MFKITSVNIVYYIFGTASFRPVPGHIKSGLYLHGAEVFTGAEDFCRGFSAGVNLYKSIYTYVVISTKALILNSFNNLYTTVHKYYLIIDFVHLI